MGLKFDICISKHQNKLNKKTTIDNIAGIWSSVAQNKHGERTLRGIHTIKRYQINFFILSLI